ncbi:MAG: translational GTPase TypA [Acholeplasmataceae bacterium]
MKIRNIAIIAHVDHGKTTLVNKLIEYINKDKHYHLEERALDSDTLEREKGITILAKNTTLFYKDYKINILDTPGHADFGGEVERIMHMVDGVLLLVDAHEGVMPQTRFVLSEALKRNIKPIVVINKIDRENIDINKTLNEVYDLFIDLGASLEDLDFKVIYGSAILSKMSINPKIEDTGMELIFETIINEIAPPKTNDEDFFLFQPSLIDYNNYVGRMGIGLIKSGKVKVGDTLSVVRLNDKTEHFKVLKIIETVGIKKLELKEASAGDIIALAGLLDIGVGETITSLNHEMKLPPIKISEPTVSMTFGINTSPFRGREGSLVTGVNLKERLYKETLKDVSLKVSKLPSNDNYLVSGRGELHLSILIENMRREGYEFEVSKPKVILKEINNETYEPYEKAFLDVPNESLGSIIEILNSRNGVLEKMEQGNNFTKLSYLIPSKSLIGFHTSFLNLTKGYGIINHSFYQYQKLVGNHNIKRQTGALISGNKGTATEYAIKRLEPRGIIFIDPKTEVYEGMIIGEHSKSNDLTVNPTLMKQLTNMRQAFKDQTTILKKAKINTLEESLSFINDDELVEITPNSIRLRKKYLKENERKNKDKL